MNKISSLFSILLFMMISLQGYSQSKISGKIVDEADEGVLRNATIMLLQAKDSILVDFTRADDNGKFSLSKSDTMDYLLIVSYPKYGESYKNIVASANNEEYGDIKLSSIANIIEEVLVTGKIPIVIKGDTTEYDAGSFTVEKNAKVEDLLKVLPGITVDASGKITAQGKTVEKVLVDGEEFFGDDPTLVTRNIRSDMVDKVQVYEKKSEQTERTGVDDGERIQTINVKLKEDAKKGMFGKAEAAGGTEGFYLGKLAFNKFKGSQKIGGYLLGSNDGTVNLDWRESEKFGVSDLSREMGDDGSMSYSYSGDEFSYWDGRGIPKAISAGISLLDAWKENKHRLNMSYKFGRIENDINNNNISQDNLLNGALISNSTSDRYTDNQRHRFNGKYDLKIDSLTLLTVKLSGSKGQVTSNEHFETWTDSTSFEQNSKFRINQNVRDENTKSNNSDFSYDAFLTRKFLKQGRSISLRVAGNISENNGDTYLNSNSIFFRNDTIRTPIDQFKDNKSNSNNFRSSVTYTEPITKKLNAAVDYEFINAVTNSINNSYNYNAIDSKYSLFDEEFSNSFDYTNRRNTANLSLNYKSEKLDFNINNRVRNDEMNQQNNYQDTRLNRSFLTYNPSANLNYKISKNKSLRFGYSRNNSLPSLFQIQPLRQNLDPLNITIGNENLKPSQNDNYNLNFHTYDMMKSSYKYVGISFNQRRNSIQQNLRIDSGVTTRFFENIDQLATSANLWMGGSYSLIKKLKVEGNVNAGANYNNNYNYINGALNRNENYNYNFGIGFSKSTTKNLDFYTNFEPGWRTIKTSLNPDFNSDGFTFNGYSNLSYYLPLKFKIYTDVSYSYEAPTKSLPEKFDRWIVKPGVSKRFLKDESLAVDLYVNDLLNQNIGFRRYQSGSTIRQDSYNTISRYFMVKVSWDFTTMKGDK